MLVEKTVACILRVVFVLVMTLACHSVKANSDSLIFDLDEYEKEKYESHDYTWANNRIGLDEIAAPWSALKFDERKWQIETSNKQLSFNTHGMLESLAVNGEDIIYAPTELELVIDGKSVMKELDASKIISATNRVIKLHSTTETDSYSIGLTSVIEYDGFTLHTLRIEPSKSISLDVANVSIHIADIAAGSVSRYLEYDFVKQRFDRSSLTDVVQRTDAEINFKFSPVISVESSRYGIEWLAQTNHGYSPVNSDNTHSLIPTDEGVRVTTKIVSNPVEISEAIEYQFAISALPSRSADENAKNEFIASAKSELVAQKRFSQFCCLKPTYFAHWQRANFAVVGLPKLSESEKEEKVRVIRQLIADDGIRFMPYTTTHILSTAIPELDDFDSIWEAAPSRRGNWPKATPLSDSMQPVNYDHKSLADFMLSSYSDAFDELRYDSIFHDVVGMSRTLLTSQKVLDKQEIESGVVFFPFYGLRKYLQRNRVMQKSFNKDIEIVFHTGALLPKSIATYADKVVFGESLHFDLKNIVNEKTADERYQPDYFSLPDILFSGPYSQKNGFTYHLLPQLQRPDVPELSKEDLSLWTRRLIAFSHLHGYPLWSTKLRTPEHLKYLRSVDKFGGLSGAVKTIERKSIKVAEVGDVEFIYINHSRNGSDLLMVINMSDVEIDTTLFSDEVLLNLVSNNNKNLSKYILPKDFRLYSTK